MLQVLLLAANPEVPRMRLDTEAREIQQAFQLGTRRDFKLHTRSDVRWRDLSQAIVEVQPGILHFSGHGRTGHLVLTDEVGGVAHGVPLSALHMLLGGGFRVRLLVLNACDTAEHAEQFLDVVDHVIAMRGAMSDDGASIFAQGFYRTLACGHRIDTCMAAGKAELAARSPDPEDVDRPQHRFRRGMSQELAAERMDAIDPLIAVLISVVTQRNVFPLLRRDLADQLAAAFHTVNDVIDIITRADAIIQQAGDAIPEPFRGHSLAVGRVPLQAGSYHAWSSAVRDSAALSPYAITAILLSAREKNPLLKGVSESIALICRLTE